MALRSGRIVSRGSFARTRLALVNFMDKLRKDTYNEITAQGHYASGRFRDSLEYNKKELKAGEGKGVTSRGFTATLKISAGSNNSKLKLNEVQSPMDLSLSKILRWMSAKNAGKNPNKFEYDTEKEKRAIAHKIRKAIRKEGVPTKGAYSKSNNGRRTKFIDVPYAKNKIDIDRKILPAIVDDVVIVLDTILSRLASLNKNIKYER